MKKIGFVYKYSSSEAKGILVFGAWKEEYCWNTTIKNIPILFSNADILSDVREGQLVYFDLDGKNATNIERASLSNFKLDYINDIIRCKKCESEYSFYADNTIISFECLDDIIIPKGNNRKKNEKTTSETNDNFSLDDLCNDRLDNLFDLFDFEDPFTEYSAMRELDSSLITKSVSHLPDSIIDLYNCFGKYNHRKNNSITIDVFDLALWIDADVLSNTFFGTTVEELKCLYDLFVMRKRYDRAGNEINIKPANDCISPSWTLLLSKFSETQLQEILEIAPKLQPALPKAFCKKNVGSLSDEYGMPDVEICKLYCLDKISKAETISEYKNIKQKLFVYSHCGATHLEGEGCPMCRLGKRRINNLNKHLEEQYVKVIKHNVIIQFTQLCVGTDALNMLLNATNDVFNNIGEFLEYCCNLKTNFWGLCENILKIYEQLPQSFKKELEPTFCNSVNSSVVSAAKDENTTPFMLRYHITLLGDWVTDLTKQSIKELVSDRFANLDNLDELNEAYYAEYITKDQYLRKFQHLTCEYNVYQFMAELSKYKSCKLPLNIQWYIISCIIDLLGYEHLCSFNYIKLADGGSVSDIRSLLKWLERQKDCKNIETEIFFKAEEKICSILPDDERWTLFEEKIIQSPGEDNIRKCLKNAYDKREANKELFKYICFQDMMLSDVSNINNPDILMFIADCLDTKHQYLMQQQVSGLANLYLWQKHPSDDYDWELIKTYFHDLSAEIQIRIMRYIFWLIASKKISLTLDELYSAFVQTPTPASPVVCGILYILREKQKDVNVSITTSMIESVISEDFKQRFYFLNGVKELFYPCNGYLAITSNQQDFEHQSFNGILTQEIKGDQLYYIITFYNTPVDLWGRPIYWLDSEEIDVAKQILVRNVTVDVVDGKYYIHKSQESFVQHFVMKFCIDDKCGLISDKERMIELGYLSQNNVYQPLYTNYLGKYDDSDNYVCRCGLATDTDPSNHIPFFWCKKKICVRRAHYLLPISKWEEYHFADLVFIALGQKIAIIDTVWRINSEISQFLNDYKRIFKSNNRNISSKFLDESEDKGTWNSQLSTYCNKYNGEDCDKEYDDYNIYQNEQTFDRYNGSYAQDEMEYSDDDIDTIFDGDPAAYWNID